MIYSVTVNPALDKTVIIPNFTLCGVNRVQSLRTDAGGKGINVSKYIAVLGGESTALALLAGEVGKGIFSFLEQQQGITPQSVWCSGETRTNLKIVDPTRKINIDINEPGPTVTGEDLAELLELLLGALKPGDNVVLAGSLPGNTPASLYRDWTIQCRQRGACVLLDADGEALRQGLEAKPDLIKPNRDELSALVSRPLADELDILSAAREISAGGVRYIVVSMGDAGAFFLSGNKALRAYTADVPVQSTVGAGDSMVAALAYGAQQGMSWEDQARLAMAFSSAKVMCNGTQAPAFETVKTLFNQIKILEVSE